MTNMPNYSNIIIVYKTHFMEGNKMKGISENSVKFLLLLDVLLHTNRSNPFVTADLITSVESAWQELFPEEASSTISPSTVGRHVKAINASKLFHIATKTSMKEGYYCDKFLFDAAEFSVIAQALFQSPSISNEETLELLKKFMHRTDALGEGYLDIMTKQLQTTAPRRKTSRPILPLIQKILEAIWNNKKLSFTYYLTDTYDNGNLHKHIDKKTGEIKIYTISPYYLVWHYDECYLISNLDSNAYNNKNTTETEKTDEKERFLTHFKVSRIAEDDLMYLSTSNAVSISSTKEYKHYLNVEEKPNLQDLPFRKALKRFPLDRYLREHLLMFNNNSLPISLRLFFVEDAIRLILMRFDLNERALRLYPINRYTKDGKRLYSATIQVQENEGLYIWLMQMGSLIYVKEPSSIRDKLKQRLQQTLDFNNYLENK